MGVATREFYLEVLEEALRIIGGAGADNLLIGSAATRILLSRPLSEAEDVDILIRLGDAERLLDVFSQEAYATYRRDRGGSTRRLGLTSRST